MSAPLPSDVVSRASSSSIDEVRPHTYGDCLERDLGGEGQPCPWVGCKHHLAVDVTPTGRLELHTPDATGEDIDWDAILRSGTPTCSLRAAGVDEVTLLEIGGLFGVSRERIRQIENKAITKLRGRAERLHLDELLVDEVDADDARRSRLEARGGVGAVRPTEERTALPPPAHLAHLPGPEGITDAGSHFWCGIIGADLTGAMCAKRHRAVKRDAAGRAPPVYPGCADCRAGAAVAARLGDVEEPAEARKARVALRVIETMRGAAATPPVTAPLMEIAPIPATHDGCVVCGGDAGTKEEPRADEPAAEVIVAKKGEECLAPGCREARGGERVDTKSWAKGLCPRHRQRVREAGRYHGGPDAARAMVLRGELGAKPDVKVTRKAEPKPEAKAPKATPTTETSTHVPAVLTDGAGLFDGISLAVDDGFLVVRIPMRAIPQVGSAMAAMRRAGGLDRLERIIAAAEAFAKVAR